MIKLLDRIRISVDEELVIYECNGSIVKKKIISLEKSPKEDNKKESKLQPILYSQA